MKFHLYSAILATSLLLSAPAFAKDGHHDHGAAKPSPAGKAGKLSPITEKDAAWAAKERKSYPVDICIASDEKLGSMGKGAEFIYRAEGQPDRFVVFCCEGCDGDFLKDPAKHLAKLDTAKAKKGGADKAKPAGGESKHQH